MKPTRDSSAFTLSKSKEAAWMALAERAVVAFERIALAAELGAVAFDSGQGGNVRLADRFREAFGNATDRTR